MNPAHRNTGNQDPKSARRAPWAIPFDAFEAQKVLRGPQQDCFTADGRQKSQQRPR